VTRSKTETVKQRTTLTIVVVGGPEAMLHAAHRVAPSIASARVVGANVEEVATVVAAHRPFAILVSADVIALDPSEFEALSRDVGATLVPVETHGLTPIQICDAITAKLMDALNARLS